MSVGCKKKIVVCVLILALIPAALFALGFEQDLQNNPSREIYLSTHQDTLSYGDNTDNGVLPITETELYASKDSTRTETDSTLTLPGEKFEPNKFSEITIHRIDNSEISIDGELNESAWLKTVMHNNFAEVSPGDNTKPEVKTEVGMFYDDNNLYFGFVCHDNDMKKIRKTLANRDNIFSDDFVGFFLDTYNEGKQAYELFVSPYGIQGDLMWTSPGNEDDTFDMIWYTASKEYSDKWTVEIAIPFKSIRFPDRDVQDWQIQFLRIRPRENRSQYSLMPISRDDPTLFTHACKVKGVNGIKGGKNIEVLPYAMSTQSGQISDSKNANSNFNNEDIKGQFGVNVKYGITSTMTADFTLNPDFSQIESDAGVITANSVYAISYSEKRPFFLEGANIFKAPSSTVYTRSINNPLLAFKLTGRAGRTEIGVLSAYDRRTPFIVPFKENSEFVGTDRKSLSNIVRLKHSINGDDSYIGFIFTDRQVAKKDEHLPNVDGFNRNFGIDGKYRFLKNYSFDFQILKSITKEIDETTFTPDGNFGNENYTKKFDGDSFSGMQYLTTFYKDAKHWSFNVQFIALSPNVRKDAGFLQSNDQITLSTWQGYMLYPETKVLLRLQPQFYSHIIHDYSGKFREVYLQFETWMQLFNQISVDVGYRVVNSEVWGGVYNQGARSAWLNFNVNTFGAFTFGGYADIGKSIIRSENPDVGYKQAYSLWSTFKPINNIVMSNSWDYFELSKNYKGEKIYAGYIFRNVTTYNLTREISFRLVSEYNSFSDGFYFNPLASYKPNPFTIFYFGFTNMYENLNTPDFKPKYVMTDRQFFLKMQYLFRI
ncbi:MAG TPA: DUF5916 domain-containing protein [Ignavibacteria bacterium]|nr:DUF5916 domain-containing protein [Ignavibacteria bacterium]